MLTADDLYVFIRTLSYTKLWNNAMVSYSSFRIDPQMRRFTGTEPPPKQPWWRRRIPKERQRAWGMVLGILTLGTIVKVRKIGLMVKRFRRWEG
jgi:hypothetical protein